ncbi:unnamed protein product [Diabrotica balteata]|uniref:BAI1-associated protein 3 n=1 Tax=Diabrotica balteata TaxID=107213 RepID=A0A9N9SZA7_DIABA|nr:unnamed protein product [Diabrotica balteata]
MSFLNSLQEYVSNSVAGLTLKSPKRFSLSRTETAAEAAAVPSGSRSNSADGNAPGFPKVIPTPGAVALVQRRKSNLECPIPVSPSRRPGSFRQKSPRATPDKQITFCCRRTSWPEVDVNVKSGIQETDCSYFESFTALAWEQENQRLNLLKLSDASTSEAPVPEPDLGISPIDYNLSHDEKQKLYVEMLYTIANTVGAPAPGGQYAHFKEDLYLYGQRAFGMPPDRHYHMLNVAGEEQPPIVVLSVVVIEAEGLEAKDANGFSDPYCMLGIQPRAAPSSPQPSTSSRTLSDVGCGLSNDNPLSVNQGVGTSGSGNEKLRKHHSFKLSFKRKDGRVREQRDSIGGALPAKFIRATSVKPHTLNPKWNEKFRFDIDDISTDSIHLDIWDHDDESSVLEAVSKLNEIRGVRGLGRFFKQVCQSARQSSQDDFLGCVTIPIQKAFWKVCPFNKEIRGDIVASLRKGTPEWFRSLKFSVIASDEYDPTFVDFCAELYIQLRQALSHYHPIFEGTNGIPYFSVVFKQMDSLIAEEVVAFLHQNEHPDTAYNRLIFSVYLEVKDLASFSQHLPVGGDHKLLLSHCHDWFEPAVSCWLTSCRGRALQRVRTAVMIQKICEGEKFVRHSSSSVDIVTMFCQLREFWRYLQWPKAQSILLVSQLLDCICSAALLYADTIYQGLMETGYFDKLGPFRISDELCISVNNLEYVYHFVSLLENYFDFLTLQSLTTETQFSPLTTQLSSTLSQFQIWDFTLVEFNHQMESGVNSDELPAMFHERLHAALELIVEFFHADGQGISMDLIRSPFYQQVEEKLQYHRTDTETLIEMFYSQRLQEQITIQTSPYGSLAVRAYFNHDSLCVEVLHARDIIPLDPNGYSDPFVIIELLPHRMFPLCSTQQTNVHKKTLNPNFDECFEFSVSLEQCRRPDTMIGFTVMDHDVITANDFAGEAFLSLGNIPGVADIGTGVENFHGLKPVELILMQQHQRNHPILQILEYRSGDKVAAEFVKKQKQRFAVK